MSDEIEPGAYTVPQAAKLLKISRNKAYRDAKADRLPVRVVRLGRAIRVPKAPLDKLLGKERPS